MVRFFAAAAYKYKRNKYQGIAYEKLHTPSYAYTYLDVRKESCYCLV
jgi:hypothetical protein